MSYTWQDVKLNIDTKAEARKEQEKLDDIHAEQQRESNLASGWSLGLGLLGIALGFGPAGFYAGKEIGKWGADLAVDWESMRLDPGKFYRSEGEQVNKDIIEAAKDQTSGQIVDSIINLASWYVASGGLTAEKGEWDPTTWGSGDAEWSLWGEGMSPEDVANLSEAELSELYQSGIDLTATGATMDYHPSLMESWNTEKNIIENIRNVGGKVSKSMAIPTPIDRLAQGVIE